MCVERTDSDEIFLSVMILFTCLSKPVYCINICIFFLPFSKITRITDLQFILRPVCLVAAHGQLDKVCLKLSFVKDLKLKQIFQLRQLPAGLS